MTCTSDDRVFAGLVEDLAAERSFTLAEIEALLSVTEPRETSRLFDAADRVRRECVGNEVHLRGIIEFSNHCVNNCLYCGLRRGNKTLVRYRMGDDEILQAAATAKAAGCPTVVLQSGEDPFYTRERMCSLILRIVDETGLVVTLSVGQRPFDDYEAFRKAGAQRYLLRHETSNPELFARLCPGKDLEQRLACIAHLKGLGFETGMGCMVGLPGQTVRDLAKDILLMKELDADMIGIGPFIPHASTPLGHHKAGEVNMVLKMVAVTRLVTRDTNIPATTALGVLDQNSRLKAFEAGANVFMPTFTPETYAASYEIYPGRGEARRVEAASADFRSFIDGLGRTVGTGPGGRPRRT